MSDLPHPRFAKLYPAAADAADKRGAARHREKLVANLSGRVVELGAGDGRNFRHYPQSVTEVIAVEPEPTLRELAIQAARSAPILVSVRKGTADELPLADEEADAAVASLVLCSVPDQARALEELARALKPGGELRFYEHVIAHRHPKRALLQFADRSGLWPKLTAGCHPARDTAHAIAAAGFTIEDCERFGFRGGALEPRIPYILGRARWPGRGREPLTASSSTA